MAETDDEKRAYSVSELGPVRDGTQKNEPVTGLRDIETHHPKSNADIAMRESIIVGVENPAK